MTDNGEILQILAETEAEEREPQSQEEERHPSHTKKKMFYRGRRLKKKHRVARWPRLSRRDKLILLLLPALAAVVAVVLVVYFTSDLMKMTLEGSPCICYGGGQFPITEGASLRRTSEDKTVLDDGTSQRTMDSLPIYFAGEKKVVFPEHMVYYGLRSGEWGQVPYLSTLYYNDNNQVLMLTRNSAEKVLDSGFLYDGADLYLFTEPVVLTINANDYRLSPLSYVEATMNGDIVVFDHETAEQIIETVETVEAIRATTEDGGYTIELLADSVLRKDGRRSLLFTRPELLEPVL